MLLSCEAKPKQTNVTSFSSLGIFVASLRSSFHALLNKSRVVVFWVKPSYSASPKPQTPNSKLQTLFTI
jgi:hypothetical protein